MIFDFDGTLADSAEWFGGVINSVARRYRFREVERAELELMRGQTVRDVISRVGLSPWKMPFVARHMRKLMARDIDQIRLFPGVDRLLHDLHGAGIKLAVVSSNAQKNIAQVLGAETAAIINIYACGASLTGKSAKFRQVLARAHVAAADVLAIGDEVRDIEAAESLGIASGSVAWGYATPDALRARAPTILFETVDQILPRVMLGAANIRSSAENLTEEADVVPVPTA